MTFYVRPTKTPHSTTETHRNVRMRRENGTSTISYTLVSPYILFALPAFLSQSASPHPNVAHEIRHKFNIPLVFSSSEAKSRKNIPPQGASSVALRGRLRRPPLTSRGGGRWSRLSRDQNPGRIQVPNGVSSLELPVPKPCKLGFDLG